LLNDFLPVDPHLVRPYVYEDERTVAMHFDMSATQSRMRRADPFALDLDYTRAMMGFLMLLPSPASMLMIGLGGGSLAKYCHRHLPGTDFTVVEINPHVIAMRDEFLVPADGERFRVVRGDGAAFVRSARGPCSVVLVDGFNYDGQPEDLSIPDFYANCRRLIGNTGVLAVNLHDDEPQCAMLTQRICKVFDADVLVVDVESGGNRIVFAAEPAVLSCAALQWDERWAALDEVHRRTLRPSAIRMRRRLQEFLPV
jgi:spermidine synthase